jgi:hypothetical protein
MSLRYYNPQLINAIRYRFPGAETLAKTYSQAGQDLFVLGMLNGKRNGTYLEIGIQYPELISNTVVLERDFGWRGISLDIVADCVTEFHKVRNNAAYVQDATTANYAQLLLDAGITDTDLDYASVDCEPAAQTLKALKQLPLDTHRFAIITFEHDYYNAGPEVQAESREYLLSKGYELIVSNISALNQTHSFEDWWAHPELTDPAARELFRSNGTDVKDWERYAYPNL